ncbi:MAG: helix-turn-helix transcriptional regulator [bacterium]|nr:helix-turn-helix transcriptional regulator [bacterium]
MLTIYEQVQDAIDLTEANLTEGVTAREAARSAGMSLRTFHRYFPALTGYRFGEYLRRRRLSIAMDDLAVSGTSILAIALRSGYDSHEAFSRAFKKEFGMTPSQYRAEGPLARRVGEVDLVGEVMMGVLTKSLPKMTVVYFDGFKPEPEDSATREMEAWVERHPEAAGSHRVFGHNIDADGRLAHEPDNYGYRVMVTVPEQVLPFDDDTQVASIEAGTFVVTGIEGSFEDDPSGSWITEGWNRLDEMVKRNDLEIHPSHRWFEEVLEPTQPGNMRFDLYAELR